MTNKRRATAYHEAGHVAIALHLGLPVEVATIVPGDGLEGFVKLVRSRSTSKAYAEKRAMVSLAGTPSQRRFDARSVRTFEGRGDRHNAVEILSDHSSSVKELESHLHWLGVRVNDMLALPHIWCQVEAIAEALIRHETLDQQQIQAICRAAIAKAISGHSE